MADSDLCLCSLGSAAFAVQHVRQRRGACLGARRYLAYYLICALSAALLQMVVASLTGAYYPTVGASGAVFGLLLAYAMLFPNRVVMPLFPPIPMRAPVFVAVSQAGVAHFAHLGGLAGSYLFMRFWKAWR